MGCETSRGRRRHDHDNLLQITFYDRHETAVLIPSNKYNKIAWIDQGYIKIILL